MQDPTLNRTDNGSLYREPFYFDIFYLMYMLNLRYMLNLIWTLTLTFVSEKKVLPSSDMLVHLMKAIWVKDGGCGTPWCPTIILSKKTISLNPVTVNHKCTWSLTRHGINHGQMPDTAGIFETGRRVETTAMMEVKGNLSRSHHRWT